MVVFWSSDGTKLAGAAMWPDQRGGIEPDTVTLVKQRTTANRALRSSPVAASPSGSHPSVSQARPRLTTAEAFRVVIDRIQFEPQSAVGAPFGGMWLSRTQVAASKHQHPSTFSRKPRHEHG
jgi:hypothetical protein